MGYSDVSPVDLVIIKYNSSGSKLWQEIWGSNQIDGKWGSDIALDSEDNIYITTSTNSYGAVNTDALIMKYNSSGSKIWNKTFGGSSYDRGDGIAIDNDDNIFIGGRTDSFGSAPTNSFIAKFNNSGEYLWNRTWVDTYLAAISFDLTSDLLGNVYLTGYTSVPGGLDRELTFFLKYNNSGSLMLNMTWGNGLDLCEGFGIYVDSLYNIYISGYVANYDGKSYAAFLLKYKELANPAPSITINSPSSNDYIGSEAPLFNITVKHRYPLNSTWYTIDGGLTNYSVGGTKEIGTLGDFYYTNIVGEIDQDAWNSASNDITLRFYTNDTLGNHTYSEVQINKDIGSPSITINSPTPGLTFGVNAPAFVVEITHPNLDTMWYTIDNGVTNITFTVNGTIDQNNWTAHIDGSVTLIFYSNDTGGNEGYTEVTIGKDTIAPSSLIAFTPQSGINIVNDSTTFVITADDGLGSGIAYIRYRINNSAWIDYVGSFNLSSYKYGDHLITFQAIDQVGNIELEKIALITLVAYDSLIITIISPGINDFFGINPPTFEISIIGINLDSTWYSLDGIINFTFTGLTGIIDIVEWGKYGNEDVYIKFYVNNTYGILNYDEVVVHKDIIAPNSTISFTPYNGTNIVIGSTLFTLTGSDGAGSGVSMIFYHINYDDYAEYDTPFNLLNYSSGNYLITYYAIDLVGNIEVENTILITLVVIETPTAPPTGSPGIPGYELISLITISLFGIAVIIIFIIDLF